MLKLIVFYILVMYILQIFYPSLFMFRIENERLLWLFDFVKSYDILNVIFNSIFSYITFYLTIGCYCLKYEFQFKERLIMMFISFSLSILYLFNKNIADVLIALMPFAISILFGARLFIVVASLFLFHILSYIILQIKVLPLHIATEQTIYLYVLAVEFYIIQYLCLLINIKNKEVLSRWDFQLIGYTVKKFASKKQLSRIVKEKSAHAFNQYVMTVSLNIRNIRQNLINFTVKSTQLYKNWWNLRNNKHCIINKSLLLKAYSEWIADVKIILESALSITIPLLVLATLGFVYDRYLECLLFCISHIIIRKRFEKPYHCSTTKGCISLTSVVIFCGIAFSADINFSMFSTLILAFCICYSGYIYQDRLDLILEIATLMAKKELNEETLEDAFKAHKVKAKYRHYLKAVLLNGQRDSDYFNQHLSYDDDPQQYRNFKTNFKKKISDLL